MPGENRDYVIGNIGSLTLVYVDSKNECLIYNHILSNMPMLPLISFIWSDDVDRVTISGNVDCKSHCGLRDWS